jgi:beta-hydroxylase
LQKRAEAEIRSMFFFKWYGSNVETIVDIPAFRKDYRFIRTIGVSVFNKRDSTSRHFGPVRATLRVLYNINDMDDRSAYIEVGGVRSYWMDDKLFIFDDTLYHQSFNESDKVRYCLFVDIVRPTPWPALMDAMVSLIRLCMKKANSVFYGRWKIIQREPAPEAR